MKGLFVIMTIFAVFSASRSWAEGGKEQDYKDRLVVKTVSGVKFLVPEDMPIVKRNNAFMPLPLEEYVDWKFSELKKGFDAIETRIVSVEERIAELESQLKEARDLLIVQNEEISEKEARILRLEDQDVALRGIADGDREKIDELSDVSMNLSRRIDSLEYDIRALEPRGRGRY